MDDYVSKPVRPHELFAAIEQQICRSPRTEPSGNGNAAPGHSEHDLLDWEAALLRLNGDEDLLRDLAEVFLEEYPKCLAAIHEGLAAQEWPNVRRAAHTLKGSLGHFMAKSSGAAALQVEQLAAGDDRDALPSAIQTLEAELERIAPVLRSRCERQAHPRNRCRPAGLSRYRIWGVQPMPPPCGSSGRPVWHEICDLWDRTAHRSVRRPPNGQHTREAAMLDLELATTEQMIAELAKRPLDFVMVCVSLGEIEPEDGYIAFSPHLGRDEVRSMLGRASRILAGDGSNSPSGFDWQDQDLDFE